MGRPEAIPSEAVAADQAAEPLRLSVTRLTLTDFRCYDHLRLDFGPGHVVLTGPNGAGKTNILEAVSFLVPGRGLRRVKLGQAGRRDAGIDTAARPWAVAAKAEGMNGAVDLGTGIDRGLLETSGRDRRVVRIDGETQSAQAVLAEHLAMLWLTPQMDRLFIEGPGARRRFLDRLVYGFDAAHAGRVTAYDHALRERVKLLASGNRDQSWLGALEETIAAKGVAVAAARLEMASRLNHFCRDDQGPFPRAEVACEGEVEDWLTDLAAVEAEDRFRDRLAALRDADADAGSTATGPHRSDLGVHHLAKDRPAADCSTGEQKALLIALVLAAARMQAAVRDAVPMLLLDEVAAHLDATRRAALFEALDHIGAQAWLTGTDAEIFAPLGASATHYAVTDARVAQSDL